MDTKSLKQFLDQLKRDPDNCVKKSKKDQLLEICKQHNVTDVNPTMNKQQLCNLITTQVLPQFSFSLSRPLSSTTRLITPMKNKKQPYIPMTPVSRELFEKGQALRTPEHIRQLRDWEKKFNETKRVRKDSQDIYVDFEDGQDITTVKQIKSGAYGRVAEICKGKYDTNSNKCDGTLFAEKVYISGQPDFNEIDILSRFDHPNLLKSAGLFLDKSNQFHLVLPLADKPNQDLTKLIGGPTGNDENQLDLDQSILYAYQILSAMAFLHSHEYYHCDLKTDNILLMNGNCVISDYGWTYPFSNDNEHTCGTPSYASPQGWEAAPRSLSEPKKFYAEKLNQIQTKNTNNFNEIFNRCDLF